MHLPFLYDLIWYTSESANGQKRKIAKGKLGSRLRLRLGACQSYFLRS